MLKPDATVASSINAPAPPALNIGELLRAGTRLATREVLAIVHEACRHDGDFPGSPDDLWITDAGEVAVARSDRAADPLDPRTGAASLLDAMLPTHVDQVPQSLRGLPARLRHSGIGPHDRRDLMSILQWHLDGDPREVIKQLAQRVRHRDTATVTPAGREDLDLFTHLEPAPLAPAVVMPPVVRRAPTPATIAIFGIGLLVAAAGAASYRLLRGGESWPDSSSHADREPIPVVPPVQGTPGLQIAVPEGAFSPAFAANGRELFFHAGRGAGAGRLLVAAFDTSGQVTGVNALIDEGARDYHPRVSPDGRRIAFDSDRDGIRGVYVAARDGSHPQRVSGLGYAAVPSWSPDMKWLAFIRGEPNRPRVWNLWLRDLSTGQMRRHTSFRSGQVWGASWFPDGRSLCYSHDNELIISRLDRRAPTVIHSPLRGHLVRTPAVSPDGTRVVFQVFKDGVWLLDVATGQMRRVLDDATAEEFAWAPDARRIAYHSRRDGEWKIWVTEAP